MRGLFQPIGLILRKRVEGEDDIFPSPRTPRHPPSPLMLFPSPSSVKRPLPLNINATVTCFSRTSVYLTCNFYSTYKDETYLFFNSSIFLTYLKSVPPKTWRTDIAKRFEGRNSDLSLPLPTVPTVETDTQGVPIHVC